MLPDFKLPKKMISNAHNTLIISNIYFETQKEFFLHLLTNDFY